MRHLLNVKIIILCLVFSFFSCPGKAPIKYPVTKKTDHVDDYFGTKVKAPYRWLEDLNSPGTARWIEAQKKVTEQYFSGIGFKEIIKARLTELWNYERCFAPTKEGEYYISRETGGPREHSVVYLQKGLQGKPEVLIDPNTFSEDGSVSLRSFSFSKDQRYLSYGISRGGSDWREFFVMNVKTRKKLSDHIQWVKFSDTAWYRDGFFYTRYAKPEDSEKMKAKNQFQKLYYHKLGTPQSKDKLIFQDRKNPGMFFFCRVTDNEKYLVINAMMGASINLLYYKNLETNGEISPVIEKPLGYFRVVGEMDDLFLVYTDYEAPNYKLILIDPKNPRKENWKTVIPGAKNKMENVSYVGGRLIVSYLKDAYTWVSVFDTGGKKLHDIRLPGIGTAFGFEGKKEDNEVFYTFTSFTAPATIYRYNIRENKSELFKKPGVKFDPDKYETRQVFYESKDKTKIPLFIVHKKGLQLGGRNPTLLSGYGGFNVSMRPDFTYSTLVNIPLLENGGVFAVACLRGGGEYGEEWHRAGMLEKKQNVFDDFIAAAEYLIASGYTSPQRLAIYSGSNGGLMVGAVINQRPQLFKAAVAAAPPMDMLRYHNFTIAGSVVGEYGSSDDLQQFKYLYKYSPLHNIKEGLNYPATLVTTGDRDDRAFPAHSFKYIATLQEKYKGKNPVLIRIYTNVGHAGAGTSKIIDFFSDISSFVLYNLGVEPVYPQ